MAGHTAGSPLRHSSLTIVGSCLRYVQNFDFVESDTLALGLRVWGLLMVSEKEIPTWEEAVSDLCSISRAVDVPGSARARS